MRSEVAEVSLFELPRIPASASALIFDVVGRLLIPKPNYKKGWTIPGGQIEPNRESPWEACQRETTEECGLEGARGRLVSVDFLRPNVTGPAGLPFLFDRGAFTDSQLRTIRLEDGEIDEHRFAEPPRRPGF